MRKAQIRRGIEVGKLVRYTGNFCQSTFNLFPPINGIVLAIEDRDDRSCVARIIWCDDPTETVVSVLLVNLELDPKCWNQSYPDLVREFADHV